MTIFLQRFLYVLFILSSSITYAYNIETCTLGGNSEVKLFRADNPDYRNPEQAVRNGGLRFIPMGAFRGDSQNNLKLENIAQGYYQIRHFYDGKLVRSENIIFNASKNMWVDCRGLGHLEGNYCSVLNPWVSDCLVYNKDTPAQQCVDWCQGQVFNPPSINYDELGISDSGTEGDVPFTGNETGFIVNGDPSSNGDFILPDGDSSGDSGFIVNDGSASNNGSSVRDGEAISGCSLTVVVSWDGSGNSSANLRSGPGTTYNKVGTAFEGDTYSLIATENNGQYFSYDGKRSGSTWYQIATQNGNAWIWGGYGEVSCNGTTSSVDNGGSSFNADTSGNTGFIIDDSANSHNDTGFIIDDSSSQNTRPGTEDDFIVPGNQSSDDGSFIVDDGGNTSSGNSSMSSSSKCQLKVNVLWDGSGDPSANLRDGPGASYQKLGMVNDGETYAVLQINRNGINFSYGGKSDSTWYQISVRGMSAWLWGGYGILRNCSNASGSNPIDSSSNTGFIIDDSSNGSRPAINSSDDDEGFIVDNSYSSPARDLLASSQTRFGDEFSH